MMSLPASVTNMPRPHGRRALALLSLVGCLACSSVGVGPIGGDEENVANAPPVIDVIEVSEFVVATGQVDAGGTIEGRPVGISAEIVVLAYDPDGTDLSYTYSSS